MEDGVRSEVVRQLVLDHYEVVYRFAYRLCGVAADAEDLTQQAFTIACRKFDQLREVERARSWLFTIVRHAYLRSRRHSLSTFSALEQTPDPSTSEVATSVPDHVDEERLQEALAEMPESFRTPVLLYFFDDRSYKEIAELLDIPIGTVMSRLSRGKAFLRERLQSEEVEFGFVPPRN